MNKKILYDTLTRMEYLGKIVLNKEQELKNAPQGKLRIAKHRGSFQHYVRKTPSDKNGEYIPKDNHNLANKLAQKEYDEAVLDLAKTELEILKKLAEFYSKGNCDDYIERMNLRKATLVNPIELSDKQFIEEWLATAPPARSFMEEGLKYDNGHGVKMRSKSEVIISRVLDQMGVPYIYEKPLKLKNRTVIPDFTILDMNRREEKYIEHLGMIDDQDYLKKNSKKIRDYEKAKIYLGKQLFLTYETADEPLNVHFVEDKLLKMLQI